ncbi:SDR family NAD(P)-dependent oxidoreductase [Streptomyces sp. NPDC021098]|uniref:SDR family NAD(P)-dependent oxidoreductase n=1 Tax=unclassified Streptomyces TaxID=2593676 RepID=UPI0037BBC75B
MGAFIVIGAGPGLGAAAARHLGKEGHPVGLIARSAESLRAISAGLTAEGLTTAAEAADVAEERALADAIGRLREQLGPIEVVLFGPRPSLAWIKPVLDTEPADIGSALDLSVVAAATAPGAPSPTGRI